MVPRGTKAPKQYRMSLGIVGMIRCGERKPATQIPSVNEIIEKHRVSNATARRILQEIGAGGGYTRVKGKSAFVREGNVRRSAYGGEKYSFTICARS